MKDAWEQATLALLTEKIGSGATPRGGQSVYVDEGTAFIRSQNVLDHEFTTNGLAFINDDAAFDLRSVAVQKGDVLLNITGDSILRCCMAPAELLPARVSQHVAILRAGPDLEPKFLQKLLASPEMKDRMLSMSDGATRKAITKGQLESLRLSVPSFETQRAIAEVLGALDDKIAANRKLAEVAESLLVARFEELGMDVDPDDAEAVSITDYFDLNPSYPKPSEPEPVYVDMKKLPTSSMAISDWDIRPSKGGARFMNGDTLLARITPCLENRKTGYVDFLDEGQVAIGSTEYIVIRSKLGVPLELSYFLAISERFRTFAIRHMVGTSGRQRLSAKDVEAYVLRTVDHSRLEVWGVVAAPIVAILGVARDETRSLSSLRDTLLPRLMSGELRVRDAERAVEAVL